MELKRMIIVISVVLLIILAIVFYVTVYPWLMIGVGISLLPDPPKPEITYGEFPFRLVYEVNGERKVIEDTLICEYAGIGMNEGQGKFREWKERLASGNKKILLLNADGAAGISSNNKKTLKQEIYYNPGSAWYYLGDYERGNGYTHSFPNASYSEQYPDGSGSYGNLFADELLEKYKIKLISWDYTQPIKNSFSTTKK